MQGYDGSGAFTGGAYQIDLSTNTFTFGGSVYTLHNTLDDGTGRVILNYNDTTVGNYALSFTNSGTGSTAYLNYNYFNGIDSSSYALYSPSSPIDVNSVYVSDYLALTEGTGYLQVGSVSQSTQIIGTTVGTYNNTLDDGSGGAIFAGGAFVINPTNFAFTGSGGGIVAMLSGSGIGFGDNIDLGSNGSASFASGNATIDTSGDGIFAGSLAVGGSINTTGDITATGGTGILTANSIVKNGGLATQTLCADGSSGNCGSYITGSSPTITGPLKLNQTGTSEPCATSGTVTWTEEFTGTGKKEVIGYASACLGASTSYTYPTAFSHTPAAVTTNQLASSLLTTLSTTAVVLTGTTSTGYVFIEGN